MSQYAVEEPVGLFTNGGRKVVLGIRKYSDQAIAPSNPLENGDSKPLVTVKGLAATPKSGVRRSLVHHTRRQRVHA